MRTIKIVADSSADLIALERADFAYAPMTVRTEDREFVDNASLNTEEMLSHFETYKGKSQTSCPNPSDWLDAFGDAEDIFCVTITSALSGSYNAACLAKEMYESRYSDRRVWVLDSLSAGPEVTLIVRRLERYVADGMTADDIAPLIRDYMVSTGLLFSLESLKNFAANGRVSMAVAKLVGVLGIRVVGCASDRGELEPLHKCRGEKNAVSTLVKLLGENGLDKGYVHIGHCRNRAAAEELQRQILQRYPDATVTVSALRGLCSYYAELGGLLVGYEKN